MTVTALRPYQQAAYDALASRYGPSIPDYDFQLAKRERAQKLAAQLKGTKKPLKPAVGKSHYAKGGIVRSQPNIQVVNTVNNSTWDAVWIQQYVNKIQNSASFKKMYMGSWPTTGTSTGRSRGVSQVIYDDYYDEGYTPPAQKLYAGKTYYLPDGSKLVLDSKGNFRVEDSDAKIIYRANYIREFNKYINASDLLEEFIRYLGEMKVRRRELGDLPISLFVNWLIIRAAEADGEEVPDTETAELRQEIECVNLRRCLECEQLIPELAQRNGSRFCCGSHMDSYLQRASLPEQPVLQIEQAVLVE